MAVTDSSDILAFADAAAWEAWLADHHAGSNGVWLLIGKKGSKKEAIAISDALDVALCYGWIDSQRKGHDADHYLQRYSPRRAKSPWSKLNVERVEALNEAGRMRPAGLAEVELARADGRWAVAYESQRIATLPDDLSAALKLDERARAAFERLDRTSQYSATLPILKATTPEARATRMQKLIARLAAGDLASGDASS
ncbi:YdeI/OmpD-associated family protein [Sphingomonas sp.]|uniref:YdeI/OmpD-associated family protein n=1 Tax=Sphingomonas sp. TaxID=28214 RepID=UPI003D6D558E